MDALVSRCHGQPQEGDRKNFDRLNEMRSDGFIKTQGHQIAVTLQL